MSEPFIGEIIMFAGDFAPNGWALCNGQMLSISSYTALFSILGTSFGGNGTSTFQLPDMRSRVPVHVGQGLGLTAYILGEQTGTENVTLNINQIPAHTHALSAATVTVAASTNPGTTASPAGNLIASGQDSTGANTNNFIPPAQGNPTGNIAGTGITGTIGLTGGSQPHPNIQPVLAVNFIIALVGLFPSRG